MILDPLYSPLDRLRPPVRIRVESPEIDVFQLELCVKVTAALAVVENIVGFHIKSTLVTSRDEMIRIQALDVRAHLIIPSSDELGVTGC